MTPAYEIARQLADRIDSLVRDLLPKGVREGRTWRAGSVAGEAGFSLSVELAGANRGVWLDHANKCDRGDALDLVKACIGCSMADAIRWSERWLRIAFVPRHTPDRDTTAPGTPTWPRIWRRARPIGGALAETYLAARGLVFNDPEGEVLRFEPRRPRLRPGSVTKHACSASPSDGEFEHWPALLALLRDIATGEPCGVHNIFLRPDGSDRLRDKKGKTTTGRVLGAAAMLSAFEDVTMGLTIGEGVETCIALLMDGLAPAWALCGAGNLGKFPVLGGIEAVTIAADTGPAGEAAARETAARWHKAGRETRIVFPAAADWAAGRRAAS
jgi:hypothetical protein